MNADSHPVQTHAASLPSCLCCLSAFQSRDHPEWKVLECSTGPLGHWATLTLIRHAQSGMRRKHRPVMRYQVTTLHAPKRVMRHHVTPIVYPLPAARAALRAGYAGPPSPLTAGIPAPGPWSLFGKLVSSTSVRNVQISSGQEENMMFQAFS